MPYRPPGRPTLYNHELAVTICERIASGDTLLEICLEDGMPKESTVRGWDLDGRIDEVTGDSFSSMYERARLMQIDHEVDELKLFSRQQEMGSVVTYKQVVAKNGNIIDIIEERRADLTAHRQVKIDAIKWRAGKLSAKYRERWNNRYGDKDKDESDPNTIRVIGGLPTDPPDPSKDD